MAEPWQEPVYIQGVHQDIDLFPREYPDLVVRVSFDEAAHQRKMIAMRGRPAAQVKLTPWTLHSSGGYIPFNDRIEVSLGSLFNPGRHIRHPDQLKKSIIEYLSHESRHACQPDVAQPKEPWLLTLLTLLVGAIVTTATFAWVSTFLLPSELFSLPVFWVVTRYIVWVIALLTLGILFQLLLGWVCAIVSYYCMPIEIDANRFKRKAVDDQSWLDLIEVKILRRPLETESLLA